MFKMEEDAFDILKYKQRRSYDVRLSIFERSLVAADRGGDIAEPEGQKMPNSW